GERVAHLLNGRMLDYMEVDANYALVKTRPPRDYTGVPLGETNLRRKYGVTVVCVKGEYEEFTYAGSDTVLGYGDVIIIAGRIEDVERFAELP
ncbi:cation:proton antiporter regulatory subunit, partial [Planomonospora parontospora]|uniref:cation:proton antiporter regulatory subunit n=1 Tax=Planomonospora parontospora TaxID=58119 RepID=UPI001670DCBE